MTEEVYKKAITDVAYLASCMVNGRTPEPSQVQAMDLQSLYAAAKRHLLLGITAAALERAGVSDDAFVQARGKAVKKVALFDLERKAILERFEEAGIWYMPLKGSLLKELYPAIGMREMADNDILCDPDRFGDIQRIMEELGYEAELSPMGVHDHYTKPPTLSFEIHRALFNLSHGEKFDSYYRDVKSRLVPEEGKRFGYHFSDEDFYLYMLTHEYKHFSGNGTGLRSLLDTYVYLKAKEASMDRDYLAGELEKLGLTEFEKENRSLSMKLFNGEPLTEAEEKMLGIVKDSGTYGNETVRAKNAIEKRGRAGYLLARTFLPLHEMRSLYPWLDKAPFLLPLSWVLRIGKALIVKPKKVLFQLTAPFRKL
jgi:hypothetical protein